MTIAEQMHLSLPLFSFLQQYDQFGKKRKQRENFKERRIGQEKDERDRNGEGRRDRDESPSLLISRQG